MLKASLESLLAMILRPALGLFGRQGVQADVAVEPLLRAELFSVEQMDRHGNFLAASHKIDPAHLPDRLRARLRENEGVLLNALSLLTHAVRENDRISPAGEWLLDNAYLIEEQIRTARRHLPKGYSRQLPRLLEGQSRGLPRVYDIAFEVISHGDGRIDAESLLRFVAAYQEVSDLTLGELWAIPIMLRLALIENLRRVAVRVAKGVTDRGMADVWADQMIETADTDPKGLILILADMVRSNPPMVDSFVAVLARRLQGHGSELTLTLTWIEQWLADSGLTIAHLVQSDTQSQAANQISISNSIGSLRLLVAIDWREFVEALSAVEKVLRMDPAGIYPKMDFATRDCYRHVIEKLALFSHQSEADVARCAISLARTCALPTGELADKRRSHVGYYLIDDGLAQLEAKAQTRRTAAAACARTCRRIPLALYLGGITVLTTLGAYALVLLTHSNEIADGTLIELALFALLGASVPAVALVNWVVSLTVGPRLLPRMDFSAGISPDSRTLVVVPAMLTSLQSARDLVEAMEVRFLANRDVCLHFALLTDFRDSNDESVDADNPILRLVSDLIEALNRKYESTGNNLFFLFHRPRVWNPSERLWMGYERKRGKLGAINELLRTGSREAFSRIVGDPAILAHIRFVITLDTDTVLARDSARKFAAAMSHPLNRACRDKATARITAGYGILQPRMVVNLPSSNRSRYAKLWGSETGLDPYTRAVSDVYQDVFGEGSFIGKGIYDVETFEDSLKNRFPEDRILSHDLLEGCYARAGLLSDVQMYEDFPASYVVDQRRRHRWIRGDWQIASWILPWVPGAAGKTVRNPISMLSRWKVLDNLRRSLIAPGLMALLIAGWLLVPFAWRWTGGVLALLLVTPMLTAIADLSRKPAEAPVIQHVDGAFRAAGRHLVQLFLSLACLPYEALISLDAIVRTVVRVVFTHRRRLEWNPASGMDRRDPEDSGGASPRSAMSELTDFCATMWSAPVSAVVTLGCLTAYAPRSVLPALPLLTLWFIAPLIAWWVSQPRATHPAQLQFGQVAFLRQLARRTWAFFEHFVTAQNHWLPPDNFQEHPSGVIAHRTSPTNMGLALLANLTAYDFGYISTGRLLQRTTLAFETMHAMDRYEGHFYNWYDTLTLAPMAPRYISSVDSGNLAAHLLTLSPGLMALADADLLNPRTFEGLADVIGVLRETAAADASTPFAQTLQKMAAQVETVLSETPANCAIALQCLEEVGRSCANLVVHAHAADGGAAVGTSGWEEWALALQMQCDDAIEDLVHLMPWIRMAESPGSPKMPQEVLARLGAHRTLREISELGEEYWLQSSAIETGSAPLDTSDWQSGLRPLIQLAHDRAHERIHALVIRSREAIAFADIQYDFLYNKTRHLLTIGYNVERHCCDTGHYDLLASEARLTSFVAIAQGQIPQENWFALGRLLTSTGGDPLLLSWSGSMFEYLMPALVMPTYKNTLLDQTCHAAVKSQIAYGKLRGVPWGISESGYNTVDAHSNFQYRAFGVPGLGLKRGLADDLVIAPYASAMALMVMPQEACANLQLLAETGRLRPYGMVEAIDVTASRLPRGQTSVSIRSFMAHHQGMILLSIAWLLLGRPMQRRFESVPIFQATTLLLQERIPSQAVFQSHSPELAQIRTAVATQELPMRIVRRADTASPEVQLLSNGRYSVMVTNAGGGYSHWKDLAVTRWREDSTRDNWGMFCYLRDVESGEFWSTAFQPTLKQPDSYEAIFSEGRAEFRRRDHGIESHTEIAVSPEDDIELRRVRLTNRTRSRRVIEITSYAEVVLATPASDSLHPAFGNLFVQTEILADRKAIICTRRPRSVGEQQPWLLHLMAVPDAVDGPASFETDRSRFIGRTRSLESPLAMAEAGALSNTDGSVLDPVVAIRRMVTLEPDQAITFNVVCGIGESRKAVIALAGKYSDRNLADRVFDVAWTHSWVNLRQIDATESEAQLYARLAGSVIYVNPALRGESNVLSRNRRGQSGLWSHAISGDLPIVLLQIGSVTNIDLVRQIVKAHAYWRLKCLTVDLVIWNEDHAGYRQQLQEQIMGLIAAGTTANLTDRPGGIFVRSADQISDEDRILFQTVARVIIFDSRGTLSAQVSRVPIPNFREAPMLRLTHAYPRRVDPQIPPPVEDLLFFNGWGGFRADGREYVITTGPGQVTPAPWVNVLANPLFGTVVSESGMAYTWSENSHEFRLSPWANDPVSDGTGEVIYLRDEDTGQFWSPTPLPCASNSPYTTRHGFGYSTFDHDESGIRSNLSIHVDAIAPVKFSVLRIRNMSGSKRRLTATGYVEWVLGDLPSKSSMHVVTEIDPQTGAIIAFNPYGAEFSDRIAFFDVGDDMQEGRVTYSADRSEFVGRNGTLRNPSALHRGRLSNRVGAGLDPCGAIQVSFELADGEEREIVFRLGTGARRAPQEAGVQIPDGRGPVAARESRARVEAFWDHALGAVSVDTPDKALNLLCNGWLVYQTLACRFWARSGFYQSGGAFGYRDQLQDAMALVHSQPALLREHILLCASRQFEQGDVQHWWHPPVGRGVRSHCSDDYLWLPQAVLRYVSHTGDIGVLEESVQYLTGRALDPDSESYYDLPVASETRATVYQHCVLAIEHGLRLGAHGLPLIGSGDWNDGMNRIGAHGQGESVWLGFCLVDTLARFADLATRHGDPKFSQLCLENAEALRLNTERHGWDGEWFRRAYFDDGTPLGSSTNAECQIDSISQSWAVLSGAGDPKRNAIAMTSLERRLVDRDAKIVRLLDPPFDTSVLNPGYIKGYVPGVRENGGQYTHAAIWATMAFAEMGDNRRAWDVFNLINPIHHARTPEAAATYKVEPYVVAADVYAVNPHAGRGGWTWYTGSAGWMYRLILEYLLGIQVRNGKLHFTPCLPADWNGFTVRYRYYETDYVIAVQQTDDDSIATRIRFDGIDQSGAFVDLVDDHVEHSVQVLIRVVAFEPR